ncbi:MAG: CinA family protein [Candidatus Omnitrophica bacterium]|nr:CinA family protein [Candidatus Omnitrophota bacterium]
MLELHRKLIKNQLSVAVAESCSGGLLSKLLTDHSGSSQYFILGVVCYSNKAKESILKIPYALIRKNGAVSKSVAGKMAQNVRRFAKTEFGIGITGIAGPTGGTPAKPVGTVFIAIASKNKTICKKFHFKGTRNSIRKQSCLKALELLKQFISCTILKQK